MIKDGGEAVRALRDVEHGTIMIALVGTLASTSIISRLSDFRRDHPGVRVELCTANSAEVSNLVRRGEATFGLRYFDDPMSDLISEQVAAEAMVVVCSADHPMAGSTQGDASVLGRDRWIAFPTTKGQGDRQAVLSRQLAAAGLGPVEFVVIDSLTAQKRLVEAGFGLAMMPESAVQEELRLGTLAVIEAAGLRVAVPVAVVRRKQGCLGAAGRSLLDMIRAGQLYPTAPV